MSRDAVPPREQVRRYLSTVRHLSLRQIATRARHLFAREVYRRCPGPIAARYRRAAERSGWSLTRLDPVALPLADDPDVAEGVLAGRFTFLNAAIDFGSRIDWSTPKASRLWRYHLHYLDVARPLAACWRRRSDPRFVDALFGLVRDHEENVGFGHVDGWHPYPLATRVLNTLVAVAAVRDCSRCDPAAIRRVERWLATQVVFLRDHLEYDVRGNHLVRNLAAVACAGVMGEGPTADRWRADALARLRKELAEQVLPDGGHYERSPHYHVIVLDDVRDVLAAHRARGFPEPSFLCHAEQRMARALPAMVHPDGGLSLFNDGQRTTRPRCRAWPPTRSALQLPDTGWLQIGNDAGDWAIMDVGEACPPFLPAHAHCDLLSAELSLGGRPVVVNSGTYEYQDGPWRRFFRSTSAHNTVSVDEADQHEPWGSFRLGRRSRPTRAHVADVALGRAAVGAHGGFVSPVVPVAHARALVLAPSREWLLVDALRGTGRHVIDSYLHFHPDVSAEWDGRSCRLGDSGFVVIPFGFDEVDVARGRTGDAPLGWFAPEFGRLVPRVSLRLRARRDLPALCGAAIVPADRAEAWQLEALVGRASGVARELRL